MLPVSYLNRCFQWFKDTNLKANHNYLQPAWRLNVVVSNGSKILIWKQITTGFAVGRVVHRCFQWFKDTNLKANHNWRPMRITAIIVVSNGSKILIWKQITTDVNGDASWNSCFQWFKDTNLKANHNRISSLVWNCSVVSNGSKILIWKQITTFLLVPCVFFCCFQWFKDTNLKANHNTSYISSLLLYVVSNGSKILIWKQITTAVF